MEGFVADPDGLDLPFGMAEGESQSYTSVIDSGAGDSETGEVRYTSAHTEYTYVGRETLDTALGSFETCHVRSAPVNTDHPTQEYANDIWYAVGSGVRLLSTTAYTYEVDTFTIEYEVDVVTLTTTAATVNAIDISP